MNGLPHFAFHEQLVVANEVKQSMTPEAMDRHAALAMTVQGPCAASLRIREACNDKKCWKLALTLALPLLLHACSKAPETPITAAPATPASVAWVKPEGANVDAIFAQAKAANKPVFLYWGAVWCPPCNQIKATVFNRRDFIERSSLFVPVYLDGDTQGAQKLGARFKVRGYPTMILFKPDGTELTRLPGEVEAGQYMEVLGLGLAAGSSAKESLAAVLAGSAATLAPEAWRLLASYSWEQDEAQLVAQKERSATLHKLAQLCPPAQREASSRLALKAMVAATQDKSALPDKAGALARLQLILGDAVLVRSNFDLLVYYAAEIVGALTTLGSAERSSLLTSWNSALDRFAADTSLSTSDRLSAVSAKVALARIGLSRTDKLALEPGLITQVRAAVAASDKATTSTYERQAVIPNAADLLSEVGLLEESDALLKAELPKALSPYYHMLVLASNARARGDKKGALDWAEQAWNTSKGPATRLQWGSGYVNRLLELTPQDEQRIEKAASAVLAELESVPETFYERNRRGLEKMGQRLLAWQSAGQHASVVKKLKLQLDGVCAKLPVQDETHAACTGVFKPRPADAKVST
jgi:thioredoxin-related protein